MPNALRASVTSSAGGVNLCPNPVPLTDTLGWLGGDGGAGFPPTVALTTSLPAPSPIGYGTVGEVSWTGPGGTYPNSLTFPFYGLTVGSTYTASIWVYSPAGSPTVTIIGDSAFGGSSAGLNDQWVQISLTFTANGSDALQVWPNDATAAGQVFYFTGGLIQPGSTVGTFSLGGGQAGQPVEILVDGSDTPINANGLPGYVPSPGDRLLVTKVGGMVEVLQFLNRGTVPYITNDALSDLQASVDANTQGLSDQSALTATVNDDLQLYKSTTDLTLGTLQAGYDLLTNIGATGVEEDYIIVGDDPALSTVKTVQISTYVQSGLYAGDYATLSTYFNLWNRADIGDILFTGSAAPPKSTFYNKLVAMGLDAMPI